MRNKINLQPSFPLYSRVPNEVLKYREQYNRIETILDDNPAILDTLHKDLEACCSGGGRKSTYSTEQFLRMIVVKITEGCSLRETIVRVCESDFLRNFTRIFSDNVMGFSELDSAIKNITPATWEKIRKFAFGRRAKLERAVPL